MNESIVPLKISSIDKLTEHWIAQGERIATERIIKLLEGWSCGLDDCPEWQVNSEKVIEFCNPRNSLIALIKGEK